MMAIGRCVVASFVMFATLGFTYAQSIPDDVTRFIANRDRCDHFRGEDPYDQERADFLAKAIEEYCRGTDDLLALLRESYQDDKRVIELLRSYEWEIEN